MSFNIVWGKSSVIVSFGGDIDTDEIIFANNKLCGDTKFDQLDYQIVDFTDVRNMDMDEHQAEVLASLDDNSTVWNTKMKVALVDTNLDHIREAKKYIELMSDTPWKIKLFENLEEALVWCKI